jgi:hypothetical protein
MGISPKSEYQSDLYEEVIDFIDFLIAKKVSKRKKKPNLDWIGGLKEYRHQQHVAFALSISYKLLDKVASCGYTNQWF